jgi:hypothetical protein
MAARRRRRGEEGAALVEAVVAIPFFLVVLGCLGFIGQTYSMKLGVMRNAREKVWAYAASNCGTRGDSSSSGAAGIDTTGITTGAEGNGGNGGANTSTAGAVGNAPHSDVISKDLGSASVTSQSDVAATGVLGAMHATPAATRKVMCNEPPYDGNLGGAVQAAWHEITGW